MANLTRAEKADAQAVFRGDVPGKEPCQWCGGIHVRATDLLCKVTTEGEVLEYCGAYLQLYREEARYLERTAPWLERVGLATRLGHYPKVLSGGEQQRVALARAFVVQPAVLLADEPTGSLDFATGERVMELMFELNRENGTTLVLVTHDREVAARCDRQLHIEAGRVKLDA